MASSARFFTVLAAITIALPCVLCDVPCFEQAFTTDFIYTQAHMGLMGTYAIDYQNRGISMNASGITEEGQYFEGRILVADEYTYWITADKCELVAFPGATRAFSYRCFAPDGEQYPVTIAGADAFVYRAMSMGNNGTVNNATSYTFTREGNLPIGLSVILPRGRSVKPSVSYFMTCQFLNPQQGADPNVFTVPDICNNTVGKAGKADFHGHDTFLAALLGLTGGF
jgi:hypothetical protein